MRAEIYALLDSTWFSEDGNIEAVSLASLGERVDSAWRTGKRAQWLRRGDFFGVYLRFLFRAVKLPVADGKRRNVREILGELKTKELEERLVRFAESIPREYAIEFPLRTSLPFGAKEVQLSSDLILVTTETEIQEEGPLSGLFGARPLGDLLAAFAAKPTRPVLRAKTFLRVRAIGFFDGSPEDSAADAALARLRQFTALSLAAGEIRSEYHSDASPVSEASVRDMTDSDLLNGPLQIPPAIARTLERWIIQESAFRNPERVVGGGVLAQAAAVAPMPEQERAGAIKRNLEKVVSVIGAKADGQNLRTAAEWYFDSQAEGNQTAALLYASIGLEAALDSARDTPTARLADRLAWLLGSSRQERKSLATEYQSFYEVRSGLVHGRDRKIDESGRRQLLWGQATLLRVIRRDLEQWPLPSPGKSERKAKAAAVTRGRRTGPKP